jgi:hypothetical protein
VTRSAITPASSAELRDLAARWRGRPSPAYRLAHDLAAVPDSGRPDTVSVVITAFGTVNEPVLRTALKSVALQRSIRVDPILVEQVLGTAPRLEPLARALGARHIVDDAPPGATAGRFSLSRARNAGIAAALGRFLYFSDADIVLADPTHLARLAELMRLHDDIVLATPRNKHLLLENQPAACDHFLAEGSWDTGGMERIGNHALRWVGTDHAGAATPPPEIAETALNGIPCIVRKPALDAYHADPAAWRGREPEIWNLIVHHGSLMARRKHLDLIAGYAECYVGWGAEDSDLQWKLAELFLVASLARLPDVAVVHLEHPRSWFDPLLWQRNQLLFDDRRRRGPLDAIASDILTGTSPLAERLRATMRWTATAPDAGAAPRTTTAPY